MAQTIYLKNGRQVVLLRDGDFERMVKEELGREAASYLLVEYKDTLADKIKFIKEMGKRIERITELMGSPEKNHRKIMESLYDLAEDIDDQI